MEVSCRSSLSSVLCVTTPFLDNENRSCYLKPYLVLFISSCLIQVHFFIPYNSSPYFLSKKCFYIFFHALRVISGFLIWLVCSHMIRSNIDVSKRQQRKWHAHPLIKFQGMVLSWRKTSLRKWILYVAWPKQNPNCMICCHSREWCRN